ncbi:MAG: hypothetical protein K0S70_25 [Microbacterium sp.]|nr:hypothetical protein [Microbacterium sp.]
MTTVKYIVYNTTLVLVGDDVAAAVMHYAAAVALVGSTEVVEVPTFDTVGCAAEAMILVGPGIPLAVLAAPDDVLEEESPVFVAELAARRADVVADRRRSEPDVATP